MYKAQRKSCKNTTKTTSATGLTAPSTSMLHISWLTKIYSNFTWRIPFFLSQNFIHPSNPKNILTKMYSAGVGPCQDASGKWKLIGIPYPKSVTSHPGGQEPASWEGTLAQRNRYRGAVSLKLGSWIIQVKATPERIYKKTQLAQWLFLVPLKGGIGSI